jgi:aryl-alcohol dehydrogenase-like predicted oxidoreductase
VCISRKIVKCTKVYGPFTNEELLGEALAPFKGKVVIASKFGIKLVSGKQVLDSKRSHSRHTETGSSGRKSGSD